MNTHVQGPSCKSCFLVALALLCGCASDHFRSGHGDVGQFILQKAVAAGAVPISTNEVLRVTKSWRYFQDDNGAVVHMAPVDYPALESFLIHTFGQPKVGLTAARPQQPPR